MPVPFGVSIGDFIACIGLIKTVTESLREAHGSAAQYRGLISSLANLEFALIRVRDLRILDQALKAALHRVALECRSSLTTFLAKIDRYKSSLASSSSNNHFKTTFRKVQWAIFAKEDIDQLQTVVEGHVKSIVLLLLVVQK